MAAACIAKKAAPVSQCQRFRKEPLSRLWIFDQEEALEGDKAAGPAAKVRPRAKNKRNKGKAPGQKAVGRGLVLLSIFAVS